MTMMRTPATRTEMTHDLYTPSIERFADDAVREETERTTDDHEEWMTVDELDELIRLVDSFGEGAT